MKMLFSFLSCLVISLFIISFIHSDVFGAEVYKITDPISIPPPNPSGIGRVIWGSSFVYEHQIGSLIFSSNPDGTGILKTGDEIQITATPLGSLDQRFYDYKSTQHCWDRNWSPPVNLSNLFPAKANYNVLIRIIDWCGLPQNISSLYFSNPDLTPPGPQPFLDLPWDYAGKGLTFTQGALSMTSYFDHAFPLLSSGLAEPVDFQGQVTTFENESTTQKSYSSHDGYDYARIAGATYDTPILAAAAGTASYVSNCSACGNMIVIDHGNGYQTRYMHLQKDGLITDQPGVKIPVADRQVIGKIGFTGHVIPAGSTGAHIHFMIVEDKNKDGNFDDNIPDGITDPLGWQSKETDPWAQYNFSQSNLQKTGNRSFYLFKNLLPNISQPLTSQGGEYAVDKYKLTFTADTVSRPVTLNIRSTAVSKISDLIVTIGPGISAYAKDALGNTVSQFDKFFEVKVDFSAFDISVYKTGSIAIYSSQDKVNWTREDTTVDLASKKATASVNHLTYFALFGERKDALVPTTVIDLQGDRGEENWFRSDVDVSFEPHDNQDGVGVDHTFYSIDDSDWQIYNVPFMVSDPGHHRISYYSIDRDDNVEEVKTVEFAIDKTPPEITMHFDPYIQDIVFAGIDEQDVNIKQEGNEVVATDPAGNKLILTIAEKNRGRNAKLKLQSLTYNYQPTITLPDNDLSIVYGLDEQKDLLKSLQQTFKLDREMVVKLAYKLPADKSTVVALQDGVDRVADEVNGLKLLQLSTQNGSLSYAY